jgi:hypothetical protein
VAVVFSLAVTVALAGRGKKLDSTHVAIENVRALVLDLRLQVGALGQLADNASGAEAESPETAYAFLRNGRLNDLRQKARLLETETSQLQRLLEGRTDAEVLKLSRELYQ